jgi:tetratricopeptide (TPR) repeat protein
MNSKEKYHAACEILMPYMELGGHEQKPVDPIEIDKGIKMMQAVIKEEPGAWGGHWMMGKAYQAMGEFNRAYDCFLSAQKICKTVPDVLRELAGTAHTIDKHEEGLYYSRMASEFDPNDAGLVANVAFALIFFDTKLAMETAKKASSLDPDDEITKELLGIISMLMEKGIQPKTYKEVEALLK